MSDMPINLSGSGLPQTVLPPDPIEVVHSLNQALGLAPEHRREAVATVVASAPRCLAGWATLGDLARDDVEAYACYRVGYHRGLDALRSNGWRGSGYVRWAEPSNHGFLRSLAGLARLAERIGESDEAERCRLFLLQLDPGGPPDSV